MILKVVRREIQYTQHGRARTKQEFSLINYLSACYAQAGKSQITNPKQNTISNDQNKKQEIVDLETTFFLRQA
jgi:hypothetical protein